MGSKICDFTEAWSFKLSFILEGLLLAWDKQTFMFYVRVCERRKIILVFFNNTEEDILWKDQLDQLAANADWWVFKGGTVADFIGMLVFIFHGATSSESVSCIFWWWIQRLTAANSMLRLQSRNRLVCNLSTVKRRNFISIMDSNDFEWRTL